MFALIIGRSDYTNVVFESLAGIIRCMIIRKLRG